MTGSERGAHARADGSKQANPPCLPSFLPQILPENSRYVTPFQEHITSLQSMFSNRLIEPPSSPSTRRAARRGGPTAATTQRSGQAAAQTYAWAFHPVSNPRTTFRSLVNSIDRYRLFGTLEYSSSWTLSIRVPRPRKPWTFQEKENNSIAHGTRKHFHSLFFVGANGGRKRCLSSTQEKELVGPRKNYQYAHPN